MRNHAMAALLLLVAGCGEEPSTEPTDSADITPSTDSDDSLPLADSDDTPEPTDSADTDDGEPIASFIEGRACPPDSPLTYENFGEGIMLSHCAGCHGDAVEAGDRLGAPLDVNLTTHGQVQDWLERVYARSADDNTTMPIIDNMDPADRVRLGDWLACGAP